METPPLSQHDLIATYVRCGLIQFGHFAHGPDEQWPLAFHLSLLPSFPALLADTARCLAPHIPVQTSRDRLLAMPDTVALGAVLATQTGLPLLYPRPEAQTDVTAAFAIEGTADVGNPTTLLTSVLVDGGPEIEMIHLAARVGVPVERVVAVLDAGRGGIGRLQAHTSALTVTSLLDIPALLAWLEASDVLPAPLVATIRAWQATPSLP